MPLRTIATLAIAIVLGLVAVVLVNGYLTSKKKPEAQPVAAVAGTPVVVAAVPIARGVLIQPQLLKVTNYPAASVPTGAFSTVAQVVGAGKDTQRLSLRDLQPDEPVLSTLVTPPGGKLNLADIIDPGMQAVTFRTSDVAGVGGFVLPGDRVDVLMTRSVPSGVGPNATSSLVTQAVAQNIRVLAIDQVDDDELNKPAVVKAITIQVTPEQAQSITLAQKVGDISLSLRHVQDTQPLAKVATTAAAFGFNLPREGPRRPRGGDLGSVRVTRMTETTVYPLGGR